MPVPMETDGVGLAVLARFERQRLPRLLNIKKRLDQGEKLTAADIAYLTRVMSDSQYIGRIVTERPVLAHAFQRAVQIYKDIAEQAAENERVP